MAMMTGLGALLGGLSNTTAARTGYGTSTNATSNASTSTPTFSQGQTALQGSLLQNLNSTIQNPQSNPGVQTQEANSTDTINKTYDGMSKKMQSFLASRGFGASGTMGQNQQSLDISRAGNITTANNGIQTNAYNTAMSDALGAAYKDPGTSSTGDSSSSGAYTQTAPGSVASGAMGGGMYMLGNMLNQALMAGGGQP